MALRGKFAAVALVLQVVFIILFGIFVRYDDPANAKTPGNNKDVSKGGNDPRQNPVGDYYAMFQDVHVMIFIGFGFLMTFLKKYGFSAVGVNMLIAALVIQWSMLMGGFLHMHDGKIAINITNLITADFAAAAVLITYGAVLGKMSPLQMILIGVLELVFYHVNEMIGLEIFHVADVGGSMFVHVFGAYFGLALARVIYTEDIEESNKEGSNYHSDIFAMIGTIFLWLFWPSFNSALATGDEKHRAVINTYLSLAACAVITYIVSSLVDKHGRYNMVHIQNSTLAGGVAIGTSADFMMHPWGALVVGSIAGVVSVLGYRYLTPFMNTKLKIHDTCGVNNLHGMPGILAAIIGAIAAALATEQEYGKGLYELFPERAPVENSTALFDINKELTIAAGSGRTAGEQAGYQMAALCVTLAMAIVGGIVTGLIMRIPIWDKPQGDKLFDDTDFWEIPDEGFSTVFVEDNKSDMKPEDSKM